MKTLRATVLLFALALVTLPTLRGIGAEQSASQTPAADQTTSQPAAPDSALTARFTTFLTDLLAGNLPATGLTDRMKTAFTPDLIAQVKSAFAPLGSFTTLQFARADSAQGFTRYHYVGVFDKGTVPLLFVVDSSGNIAGFFRDEGQ